MVKNTKAETPRRERRKEETRNQIFQAAMKLFEKKGAFNTTVEEITAEADVAKGTFFNYFPSKEAIFGALAERQLGIISRAVERSKTAPSVRPVLIDMCKELGAGPGRSQLMLRSVLGMVLSHKFLMELFAASLGKGRAMVAEIISRGQVLGEVRSDLSAIELARVVQHSAFGTNFIWAVSPPSDLSSWHEKTMDVIWRGIASETARNKEQS